MHKRLVLGASACLIVIVVSASLVLYAETLTPHYDTADGDSIVWQVGLEHFVDDFAVADGRVFIAETSGGGLQGYDANNGQLLWNQSIAGTQVAAFDGKVYVATNGLNVDQVNERTGEIENSYGVLGDEFSYKWSPTLFIADNKLFASHGSSIAVYSLETNQELWSNFMQHEVIGGASNALSNSTYIYVHYNPNRAATYRLNPNSGDEIWKYSGSTGAPITSGQQVILWNSLPSELIINGSIPQQYTMVCLDVNSAEKRWDFNTTSSIFEPIIREDVVLFAAHDGYFYALNISDGSLKWKINVDPLDVIKNSASIRGVYFFERTAKPLLDAENQSVYWTLIRTDIVKHYTTEESSPAGMVIAVDLQNASTKWYTPLNSSAACVGNGEMALLNNRLFVSGNAGLLCLNADSGGCLWERSFDHYVNIPIVYGNRVFVTADTYVISYK
ncbi:MAG: PQQ-like beta-propeller repeat protein [Candidatus Bathyarchaeota archaeon]|nr:PQQ-like beta-propeller repeat protein [Candidatus Bathyarchaeota archaeon]